jgi:hypothetical protein
MLATDFHKEYLGLSGEEAFTRFHKEPVAVRGVIKRVVSNSADEVGLWLEVDGVSYLSVKFADGGEKVRKLGFVASQDVSVSCHVGGMMGSNIMLVKCALLSAHAGLE